MSITNLGRREQVARGTNANGMAGQAGARMRTIAVRLGAVRGAVAVPVAAWAVASIAGRRPCSAACVACLSINFQYRIMGLKAGHVRSQVEPTLRSQCRAPCARTVAVRLGAGRGVVAMAVAAWPIAAVARRGACSAACMNTTFQHRLTLLKAEPSVKPLKVGRQRKGSPACERTVAVRLGAGRWAVAMPVAAWPVASVAWR